MEATLSPLIDIRSKRAEHSCSFGVFLAALDNPLPAFTSAPRTLRHVGHRSFGNFGTVLLAEKPATADLSDRVQRWRAIDASTREDAHLQAHADQTADDRRFRFFVAMTAAVIIGWLTLGISVAAFAGKL